MPDPQRFREVTAFIRRGFRFWMWVFLGFAGSFAGLAGVLALRQAFGYAAVLVVLALIFLALAVFNRFAADNYGR